MFCFINTVLSVFGMFDAVVPFGMVSYLTFLSFRFFSFLNMYLISIMLLQGYNVLAYIPCDT